MTFDSDIQLTTTPTIDLPHDIAEKFKALAKAMNNTECGGFLVGSELTVTDLIIPDQTVSGARWTASEIPDRTDILGTIHSHHTMGTFRSAIDNDNILSNWDLNIIYSFKDDFKGYLTITLPDNQKYIIDADIIITNTPSHDQWVEEQLTKIHKQAIVPVKKAQQKKKGKQKRGKQIYPDPYDDYDKNDHIDFYGNKHKFPFPCDYCTLDCGDEYYYHPRKYIHCCPECFYDNKDFNRSEWDYYLADYNSITE